MTYKCPFCQNNLILSSNKNTVSKKDNDSYHCATSGCFINYRFVPSILEEYMFEQNENNIIVYLNLINNTYEFSIGPFDIADEFKKMIKIEELTLQGKTSAEAIFAINNALNKFYKIYKMQAFS